MIGLLFTKLRNLILGVTAAALAGCSVTLEPTEDLITVVNNQGKAIQQQSAVITAIVEKLKDYEKKTTPGGTSSSSK